MLFVEIPRRKADVGKPRVEVGVAERAFSSQTASTVHAVLTVKGYFDLGLQQC